MKEGRKEEIVRVRRRKGRNHNEISRVKSMTVIPNNQLFWFHMIG